MCKAPFLLLPTMASSADPEQVGPGMLCPRDYVIRPRMEPKQSLARCSSAFVGPMNIEKWRNTMSNTTKINSPRPDNTNIVEADLAQDKMGNNRLQGNDQSQVRNQRQAVPDVKLETDGVIESFEKLDKDVRAERDLGKGNRSKGD